MTATARPRLRPGLEAHPLEGEVDEAPAYLLQDPLKLADPYPIPVAGLALASLMDGTRTVDDLADAFAARHGARVDPAQVRDLVAALDAAGLLEGPGLRRALEAFARSPVRPAACIGSYPGEAAALRRFLDAQWAREGGPGAPPLAGATRQAPSGPAAGARTPRGGRPGDGGLADAASRRASIRAFASPHIDIGRGGATYAHAWRAVAEDCPAEVFVVFGTPHTGTAPLDGRGGPPPRFALTRKAFDTPLGAVPAAVDVLDRLVAAYDGPDDLFAGEVHHRREHSIEFQAVWLQHLFGGRRPLAIVPVLCGSLHDLEGDPTRDPRLEAFHRALRAALAPLPAEKVAFVAGIDLAHVGAQFGRPAATRADVDAVERADRELLRLAVEARDPDAVHRDIRKDDDARSVCGHAPLVATLTALAGERLDGELVRWDRWWDGRSAVSFAGATWRAPASGEG